MFGKKQPEVIVVGAGPVGLFTALCLARRGVDVQIVDEAPRTAMHSYALALHGDSLSLLQEHGLADEVIDASYRVNTVGLYDKADRRAQMRLVDLPQPHPFVAVMRQDVLEGLLERALKQAGVKILWNHRASRFLDHADNVQVTVDRMVKESVGYAVSHTEWMVGSTKEMPVAFVIGADGHRSLVRRQHEIDFPECAKPQQFAVFEFETDADLHHEMRLVLEPGSTNVLWPLPDGFCRFSFEIGAAALPADTRMKDRLAIDLGAMRFPVLGEDFLRQLIQERAPWFEGSIGEIRWRMAVRFERRMAEKFGDGRVWLVGDAGHITGPVGGQSMNVGLREADQLAKTIGGILRDGAPLERLATYAAQRRDEWRGLLGLEGGLEAGGDADAWVRDYVDRLLPCIPGSGETLSRLVAQLGIEWTAVAS
jgi:2-polyprenyl-6-methoxyphenol hydroxylase-like FAD-dependent oxidoreductase